MKMVHLAPEIFAFALSIAEREKMNIAGRSEESAS
jgi:hypothetical protein